MRSVDQLEEGDFRRFSPRFQGDNLAANIAIVEAVDRVAKSVGATPAQVALAWVYAKGEDLVPIPGTKRRALSVLLAFSSATFSFANSMRSRSRLASATPT